MANKRVDELASLGTPAAGDLFVVVDVSDSTMSAQGTSKKMTLTQLKAAFAASDFGLGNVDNTSDATKNAAAVTLTNKTFALGSNTFSGTKAQFDTAVTDGNFLYVGDVTQYTNENAQDAVGGILTDSSTIDFTYDDTANTITAILVDGSVTNAKVATGIDAAKIGGGAVSNTEFGYLDGVTSAIQTQLNAKAAALGADDNYVTDAQLAVLAATSGVNTGDQTITLTGDVTGTGTGSFATAIAAGVIVNADVNASAAIALSKLAALTASRALVSDGSGFITVSSVTATELGYVSGVTSALQTQLNAKQGTISLTTTGSSGPATLIGDTLNIPQYSGGGGGSGDVVGPASSVNNNVALFDGTTGKLLKDSGLALSGSNTGDQTITLTGDITGTGTGSFATAIAAGVIINADINASAAIALSKLAAMTASRAVVSDGSGFLVPATTTAAEIGYVNGVTSAIQTQLDGKQPLDSDLTTLAGLTATTDNFIVSVSSAWASRTPAQVRTTLGLVIGTNVQAWDADLDTWATKTAPSGAVVGISDTQTLTNKSISLGSNTVTSTIAQLNVAVTDANLATEAMLDAIVYTKTITVESPGAAEDLSMFFADDAITITKMVAVLVGSSTPSVTWTVRHSTDRSATGNQVVTGGTTTTSTTSGSVVTSFNDATVPADSFVWLETTAQSGTVGQITITVHYTID